MLTVNFIPKNSPNTLTFVFTAFKNADALYRKGSAAMKTNEIIEAEDDFETKGTIRMEEIAGITFSEYEKDMERNGDLYIIQQKSSLKTQKKANSDIGLHVLNGSSALSQ